MNIMAANFGTPVTSAPATNFSFGAPISLTPVLSSSGFGITNPASNTATLFGAQPLNTQMPTTGFSMPTNTGVGGGGGGFNFGSTASTSLANTATTSVTGFTGFGLPKPTLSTATATFGPFDGNTTTTTTTAASGFSFSNPTTSISIGTVAPQPLTTNPSFGTTTGIVGISKTVTTAGQFDGTSSTGLFTTSNLPTATNTGLGGIDINATQPKIDENRSEVVKAKETQMPQEIVATVSSLKSYVKQQKTISSDIARTSNRKLFNVSNEIENLNFTLAEFSNCLQTNYTSIKLLRNDTAEAIQHTEMAQRTHETPAGLQFENVAPLMYFSDLIRKYELDMITFKKHVELAEKHMVSLTNPQNFTAEDLKKGMQQLHESFIALAGLLHECHQKVEVQKAHYLKLRKHLFKDDTNVFDVLDSKRINSGTNIMSGPTPFSTVLNINLGSSALNQNSSTGAGLWSSSSNTQQIGGGGSGLNFSQNSAFNNTNTFTGFGNTNNFMESGFNLQKPPIGSKRYKH